MDNQLLHTPDGVRDIYGQECIQRRTLENRLTDTLISYGYSPIRTPTFEYFDVFDEGQQGAAAKDMYRFIDRDGAMLVLRPDITPAIARAAAKYYPEETLPLRFAYHGNVFINHSSYQGLMKETTQLGAELIGDSSPEADAEMIALSIRLLKEAGLNRFVLDIGHAGFMKTLLKNVCLQPEDADLLKNLIENRNFFGIERFVKTRNLDPELQAILIALPRLSGQVSILDEAAAMISDPEALAIIRRLASVWDVLCIYGCESYITFDLAMFNQYDYYSGIIFRGYTYGVGDALIKGGRYDHLLSRFGTDRASVGFVLMADELMMALSRQQLDLPEPPDAAMVVFKTREDLKQALKAARRMRQNGIRVTLMNGSANDSSRFRQYCGVHRIRKLLIIEDGEIREWEMSQNG